MKNRLIFLFLLILLYSACQKKEKVTLVTKTTIDSTKKVDTPVTVPVIFKSYTDTFIGSLQNYVYGPPNFTNSDTSFTFYVFHMGQYMIVISNPKAIQLDQYPQDSLTFNFQTQTDSSGIYSFSFPYANDRGYGFRILKDSIYVNWDYGVNCWYYEYKGSYAGKKQ